MQNVIPAWDNLPALPWLDKVSYLTHMLLKGAQIESPVTHMFENGQYIRELKLPAGAMLTGREHLLGHEMQLTEGSVIVAAPDGKFTFHAPASLHSKPGFHAVVYCLTDITARTVHPNPEGSRDIEALEAKWFGRAEDVIARGAQVALLIERERIAA